MEIEDLGYLGEALNLRGIGFEYVDAVALPRDQANLSDALIVLGGPLAAYDVDRYPFLVREIELIRRFRDDGHPVLGICLGAQLVAAAAGASVYPGRQGKEIGWAAVELSEEGVADPLWAGFPTRFDTFHWHGDTFDVPDGADVLARTSAYPQAFRLGSRVYGIQFHPEVVPARLESWIKAYRLELERERLSSENVLTVPDPGLHRDLAFRLGENVARWLIAGRAD